VNAEALPAQIGKYWVKRLLGSGGMGRVFLAVDPDIGREVAIKLVTLGKDPQANERFLREAQTMGRMNHPNIVTLLEFGVDQQTPFLVLEFLSGEDLSQWMHRAQPLRAQVQVMLGVAEAIAAAHRVGVLHRDLKPENVRVLEDGRSKLLDFGIAQSGASSLTASGYFVGTPEFVAPEVMSGAAHTALSDIYSLGLLFYTMLAGDNPFRGDTVQSTVARVIATVVPPLSSRVIGVPAGLAALVQDCLQKQPEQRPLDAGAVVARLQEVLSHIGADAVVQQIKPSAATAPQPILASATRTGSKTSVAPSKRPWLLALGALLVVAVGAWWLLQAPAPVAAPEIPQQPVAVTPPVATSTKPEPKPADADTALADPIDQPVVGSQEPAGASTSNPDVAPEPVAAQPPRAVQQDRPVEVAAKPQSTPVRSTEPRPSDRERTDAPISVQPDREPAAVVDEPATAAPAPPVVAAQPPAPEPEPAKVSTASVIRCTPKTLRAGRSATMRIEGSGLAVVQSAKITSGGAVDSRFGVGELRHSGDGAIEFSLKVARGVPLGSYALLLQGPNLQVDPILLEVSL
jgi:eukaryotic-like serine/threonine-protein kinase